MDDLRHRLQQDGESALSEIELLAVNLRIAPQDDTPLDLARRVLAHFGTLRELSHATYHELLMIAGLRPAQAQVIVASFALGRRAALQGSQSRPIVQTAEDAANLLSYEMEALHQEHLRVILLDAHRRVIASPTVYIGSLSMTLVRAAEVFREAISRNCASLILVHNHPSGDPTPSASDVSVTENLVSAGKLLDIAVLDHLIIGHGAWLSLRDTGVGFD